MKLVEKVQKNNNEEALKKLIDKYENMGSLFNKVSLEPEDKKQIITIAIYTAAMKYKKSKKIKFSTHLWQYLRWLLTGQDNMNRTGKKVNPLIFSGKPNLKKSLRGDKAKNVHISLFKKGIVKKEYVSPDKSFGLLKDVINDIGFYKNNLSLFNQDELSFFTQRDIEYYERVSDSGKLNTSNLRRIRKMNFFLLNHLVPFYAENEFFLQFENEFENGIREPQKNNNFEYSIFYEDAVFQNLTNLENFIMNYLYNFDTYIDTLYEQLLKFRKITKIKFNKKIAPTIIRISKNGTQKIIKEKEIKKNDKIIKKYKSGHKILADILDIKINNVRIIEKKCLKKIKQKMKEKE